MVGDDAQSIYSFRAATVRNILDFPHQFAPPAEIVTLEHNYRSTQPILDAANAVIELAPRALHQEPVVRARLGRAPGARHRARRGRAGALRGRPGAGAPRGGPRPQAARPCCFAPRTTAAPLEIELDAPQHPVRQVRRPASSSRPRMSRTCSRSCAGRRIRATGWRASASCSCCPASGRRPPRRCSTGSPEAADPLDAISAFGRPPPRRGLAGVRHTFELARRKAAGWPAELELVRRWYEPHLERLYEDAVVRAAISTSSSRSPRPIPSRERFLTELTLDPPDATSDEAGVPLLDEDYLILSTIHSAKGQEWTIGVRAQLRRRLHPVRPRDRRRAARSRRSAGCSTWR